ncbi:MAG: cyclic nucleotide-binding domain-containing protein [Chromatiales bacterium]|jgi:CRP-like cAMP-binding protein
MSNILDITMGSQSLGEFYPLSSLPHEDIKLLNKKATFKAFQHREIIFVEGSDDTDVLYLVSGSIRLVTDAGDSYILDAGSDQAIYPIANLRPRRYSAFVNSESASIAKIPMHLLDEMLRNNGMNQFSIAASNEQDDKQPVFDSDWMMAMLKTPLFKKIPYRHIEKLFDLMQEVKYKAGDAVVTQGEQGDYYYLVEKGRCLVSRHNGMREVTLAEIGPTDSFGEEALLTDTTRNATVRMLTNGRLMRLSKTDFNRFMHKPIVHLVDMAEANLMIRQGAVSIDVRPQENAELPELFHNAKSIPLYMLRSQMKGLSRRNRYVLFCDDGEQSAAASYLLSLRGLETFVLRGGLNSYPALASVVADPVSQKHCQEH